MSDTIVEQNETVEVTIENLVEQYGTELLSTEKANLVKTRIADYVDKKGFITNLQMTEEFGAAFRFSGEQRNTKGKAVTIEAVDGGLKKKNHVLTPSQQRDVIKNNGLEEE